VIIDIKQAEQLRHDIVTIAQVHARSALLFTPDREQGLRALLRSSPEDLVYVDVSRTAFAHSLWGLLEYAASTAAPPPPMELLDWVACHGVAKYLLVLMAAGEDGKLSVDETCAVERCLTICRSANERFTSINGWSFLS